MWDSVMERLSSAETELCFCSYHFAEGSRYLHPVHALYRALLEVFDVTRRQ